MTGLFFAAAAISVFFAFYALISGNGEASLVLFLIGAFCGAVTMFSLLRAQGRAERAARDFINAQARVLARKRAQLVSVDDYGREDTSRWEKEKSYILSKVIPEHLAKAGHSQYVIGNQSWRSKRFLLGMIETTAITEAKQIPPISLEDVARGTDYEKFCAEALKRAGWRTQLTKASGDQGSDIIAEQDNHRVILQCKYYTSKVGNKAVQEAVAARLHERADKAVVVSNASYTKSARQLAATTGVLLLHHDDLGSLIKHFQ